MSKLDPERQRAFAIEVVDKLRAAGYTAYWAGGCVRDQLLGLVPKDYDVATSALPDEIRETFGRRRTLAIGAAFGVISVLGPPGAGQVEVTTFREEAGYSDGRHPDRVTFSTPQEDAQRRDFTINGLYYDPHEQRVIDYVGGEEDLGRKRVRAIGNPRERFEEDKLRLLRAVRLAANFEFQLDEATLRAVQEMARQIEVVSAERIGAEMRRMLTHPTRVRAVELLCESSLMDVLLPEVAALSAEDRQETFRVLGALEDPSFSLALAALLHRAGGPSLAEEVADRLRLTNKETRRAAWLLDNRGRVDDAAAMPWPRLQRLLVKDGVDELLALAEAIAGSTSPGVVHCRKMLLLPPAELNPPPLVTGDDLIAHGIRPGKSFRRLLDKVRDAQLEKTVRTREEALALVDRLLAES